MMTRFVVIVATSAALLQAWHGVAGAQTIEAAASPDTAVSPASPASKGAAGPLAQQAEPAAPPAPDPSPAVEQPTLAPVQPLPAPPAEAPTAVEQPAVAPVPPPGATGTPVQGLAPPPIPVWEEAQMAARPVDPETIRYRPGKGLEIRSAEGDFAIITRLRAQFLYDLIVEPDVDDAQNFQIRRARLQFAGNLFGEHNRYKVEIALSPRDLARETVEVAGPIDAEDPVAEHLHESEDELVQQVPLLDWFLVFDYLRDLTLVVGQYKVPYSRQRVISSGDLQFVDRSLANGEFTLDRDIGFDLRSPDLFGLDLFRYYAGVYIGEGRNISDRSPGAGDFGLMYLARLEFLPFGMFDDYSEADFDRSLRPGLSLGLAYAYVDDAPGTRGILGSPLADEVDFHNATADVMFKWRGLSVFSEIFYRAGDAETDESRSDGVGFMAQAGYLLPWTALELAARYSLVRSLADDGDSELVDDENEAGLAVSYYFAQHPFKLQADVFQQWEQAGSFGDGATVLRVQLQASL